MSGLIDTPDGQAANAPAAPPPAGPAIPIGAAVVFANAAGAHGHPTALLAWDDGSVLERLVAQIVSLGIPSVIVIARPGWAQGVERALAQHAPIVDVRHSSTLSEDLRIVARVAATASAPVLVVAGDVVLHRGALAGLVANPRAASSILAGGRHRPLAFRVQMRRGHMVGATSPYHAVRRPNASFLGVLRVGRGDLETLAAAAERLASLTDKVPASWADEFERKAGRWRRGAESVAEDGEGDDHALPEDIDEVLDDPPEANEGRMALSTEDASRVRHRIAAAPDDATALLLVGLVRSGATIRASYLRGLFWARPLSAVAAGRLSEQIREYDEDRLLLDAAVKSSDGFFTTFFVSPYSRFIARWAARRGLTPNQVTIASMAIGALAAAAFATGERWGLVAGALLLQASFVADCVDGQLARYTRRFSTFGAWLDSMFDRTKEYLVFAGLALGASRTGEPVWGLACAALTLQTVRHMSDFSYMTAREQRLSATPQPPLEQPLDNAALVVAARREAAARGTAPPPPAPRPVDRFLRAWHRLDRTRAVRWMKRMIAFPIGERFVLISLTAALFSPRVTFLSLLVVGGVAFAYTHAGRIVRTAR